MTVGANIERFFSVLTDFEQYSHFLPDFVWTDILDMDETTWVVEHKLQSFGDLAFTLKYTADEPYRLAWSLVGGVFEENRGEWRLVKKGPYLTEVSYSLEYSLSGLLPGIVQAPIIEAGLPSLLRAFRQRAEEHPGFPGISSERETGRIRSFDGAEIWYEYYGGGDGVPFVFCNGLMQDTSAWVRLVKYFQGSRPLLLWDYRWCGGSDRVANLGTLDMEHFTRDLLTLLESRDLERAVFLGHSMGVLTILEFYRRYPRLVAGLIPVCGSFEDPFKTIMGRKETAALAHLLLVFMGKYPDIVNTAWRFWMGTPPGKELIRWLGTNRFMVKSDDLEGFLANFGRMDAAAFSRTGMNLKGISGRDMLGDISVPVLIVAGENDFWTPFFISEEMSDLIPGSELCLVPRGSHTSLLDIPELLGLRIEKFLVERLNEPTG